MKKTYEYENIQIGNFLVSIGYYLRDFDLSHPIAISLNQQTPNDPTLGDLFGSFSGHSFLIEFKSHEKNIEKEYEKPARRQLIHHLENDFDNLVKTSFKSHFICYPTIENNKMNFNLKPYINFKSEKIHIKNVKDFIEMTVEKEVVGANFDEIKEYIKLLEKCSKKEDHRDSSGASSGILMNFDKKEGIKYILYEGYDSLNIKLKRSISFDIKLVKKREKKKGISRGR